MIEKRKRKLIDLWKIIDIAIYNEIKQNYTLNLKLKQYKIRSVCIYNLGRFNFSRIQYKYKTSNGWRTICLLDYFLNLRKRAIMLKGSEMEILDLQLKKYSTRQIASKYGIFCQTVANYNKNTSLVIDEKIITNEVCDVYIAADSIYTHVNRYKGRKHEIKTLVLWTNDHSNTKSKLADRVIMNVEKSDMQNLYGLIKAKVNQWYPNHKSIKVIGDGALWIKELGNSFDGFHLDKFHYMNAFLSILNTFILKHKKIQKNISLIAKDIVYKNAESNNSKSIITMLTETLIQFSKSEDTKMNHSVFNPATGEVLNLNEPVSIEIIQNLLKSDKSYKYVNSNWGPFCNTCLNKIPNPIEALQSHYVTSFIRRHRTHNSKWLNKLILTVKLSMCNQFDVKLFINNPFSDPKSLLFENNDIYKDLKWYNENKVTRTYLSRSFYATMYKSPRVSSIY